MAVRFCTAKGNARLRERWFTVLALLLIAGNAGASEMHHALPVAADCSAPTPALPAVHCGSAPTVTFDRHGRVWVAYEYGGTVYVSSAKDTDGPFGPPAIVNTIAEEIDINGENRTKIAFGADDELYVSWTKKVSGGYNGEIRFSRSLDGGRHFDAVRTINDDGLVTGHRFETLLVDARGYVYLAWLDKRDLAGLSDEERRIAGAAVYYTVSTDRGATFARNRRVTANSCECCRIAAAETPEGDIALFFREIFDQHVRDHGFAIIDEDGIVAPMRRATEDDWRIDACPHHGPTLLSAGDGTYDMAWFTHGARRKGIYYGRFDAANGNLENLTAISQGASAGHPSLAETDGRLELAWKEFDGKRTNVHVVESQDGGANWSPRRVLASTQGGSDHPFLIRHNARIYLSWYTADEGLRIQDIGETTLAGTR